MTLVQAILLIPPGFHLQCGREVNPETGTVFGSACLFAEPPEDGWTELHHPADRFRDKTIASITTGETDFEAFELLLVNMIVQRYGTDQQKDDARAALDQRAWEESLS
jgi:hypothetical protein